MENSRYYHIWILSSNGNIYWILRNFFNNRPEHQISQHATWETRGGANSWARQNLKGKEYMVLQCKGENCPVLHER